MKKNIKIKALTTLTAATGITIATVAQACASGGGEVQSQNELLVQQTLVNLNNSGTVPTPGSNEAVVFDEILNHLQSTEPSIENITQITISDPESSVSINTEEGTVTVNANSITLQTTGGIYRTYANTSNLVISNIVAQNDVISSISVSGGNLTASISDSEFLQDIFFNLVNTINNAEVPATNSNEFLLLTLVLTNLNVLPASNNSITTITSINIAVTTGNSERDAIEVSNDASQISIAPGTLTITTNGDGAQTYVNTNSSFLIQGLVVNEQTINTDSASITGIVPEYDFTNVVTGAVLQLNNITEPPAEGTNARVFYDTFLVAFQSSEPLISAITSIIITNPNGFSFTTDNSSLTILEGAMNFTVENGQVLDYNNETSPLLINNINFDSTTGLIDSTSVPVITNPSAIIPQLTNSEIIIRDVTNLTNFSSTPPVENVSEHLLWTNLQTAVRAIDDQTVPGSSNAVITSIVIENAVNPGSEVFTNGAGNLIGITQNSIFITTTGATFTNNYTNLTTEFAVADVVISNRNITSIGSISGLEATPSGMEVVRNFGRELNGATDVPTNPSVNVLYTAILNRLNSIDNSITEITSITITSPLSVTSSEVVANAAVLTISQNSLAIETNSTISAQYDNSESDFVLDVTLNTENNLIQTAAVPASANNDLVANPSNVEILRRDILGLLNINGSVPSDPNQAFLYNQILTIISNLNIAEGNPAITQISSFSISDPSNITINNLSTGALLAVDSVRITGTDGTSDFIFSNQQTEIIIPSIVYNNSQMITSIGTITGLSLFTPSTEGDIADIATLALNSTSVPASQNALTLWNQIQSSVINAGWGITGINAISISSSPTFSNNQIVFAANSLSINYNAYLSPGVYVNSTEYVINVSISLMTQEITITSGATGTFEIELSSNNERLQFAWNIVVNVPESQLSSSSLMSINPTAERLLNTIEGRIESFNGVTITLREDVVSAIAPVFTNTSVSWQSQSFNFFFTIADGRQIRGTPAGSGGIGYSINNLTFTDGNLNAVTSMNGFIAVVVL